MLQIYNSLSRTKEVFQPRVPGKVSLYVCGNTVYDYCHLGHARTMTVFDVINRYLRASGYEVTYVRNITDIDDKIIKRAQEAGIDYQDLTAKFITAQEDDCKVLDILTPDYEPRATQYIAQMISLIEKLMEKEIAYVGDSGDVYYAVSKFPHYGCLAHQDLDKLRAGARISVVQAKQDPLDFVLWKLAKPGEPSWQSPWGEGRPGWHIECSAMSIDHLGQHFDIHGGGFDLTFPHHENEIAQSEAATGQKFVNYWMHVGFLQIDKEKMSKSLGNFLSIRDALSDYPAEVIRFFLLSSHYRSPLNYSPNALQNAQAGLERFYLSLRNLPEAKESIQNTSWQQRFNDAMNDDFNIAEAVAVMFDLAREINRLKSNDLSEAAKLGGALRQLGKILGILQQSPDAFLQKEVAENELQLIESLVKSRQEARQRKDWQKADELRQELLTLGIVLEDSPTGTIWRREHAKDESKNETA